MELREARGGYAAFDDESERDERLEASSSFNTGAGSSPGDLTPPLEPEDEGATGSERGDVERGGGGGHDGLSDLRWIGGGHDASDAPAPDAFSLLRAFLRGLAFPLAMGQQLGRVPFLASVGPWALALALPVVFLASAPHGAASVSAAEGFGPLLLLLASTHLAALGDDYAGTALLQLQGLSALAGLSLTLPGGAARPANELAADLRARASRWKSRRLFTWPFIALCVLLGSIHASLPALQRSWLGQPLLGANSPDGRASPACACVALGGFLASSSLFAVFVFFGRFYLLGLHELARRWAIFARLTPCLWPSEPAPPGGASARAAPLAPPHPSLLENGLAWVRIRALLRADAFDVSVSAQLYFGSALGLLAAQWLYLVPRLLARPDALSLRAFDENARGGGSRPSPELAWLSLVTLIGAFDAFVAVPILISSFFAAFRVNQLQRAQTQAVRRARQYACLLVAHGAQQQHAADAAGTLEPCGGESDGARRAAADAPLGRRPLTGAAGAEAAGTAAPARAGPPADSAAVYRAYADFLGATVDAMANEERDASVAGVPVGPATVRIVAVLGAAGFFAALYYLSVSTISFSAPEEATPAVGGGS